MPEIESTDSYVFSEKTCKKNKIFMTKFDFQKSKSKIFEIFLRFLEKNMKIFEIFL